MREKISIIRLPLIDNYIKIIHSLAKSGRNSYQKYLIQPLLTWASTFPTESIDKLISLIEEAEKNKSKKLPLLYKMAIIKSLAPDQFDLSIPGNISIDFLKCMSEIEQIALSDEALEFVNILKSPFKEYSEKEFIKMNKQFEEEINTADNIEVEKLIKIHEGIEAERKKIDDLSQKTILNIENLMKSNNATEIKRSIISYLLKFSDPSMPNQHMAINKIIDRMQRINKTFHKDIMDTTAIITYHEILKAIKDKNLTKAVKYIGKYTVLFRGNPNTPNFYEVDSFEKKFYNIIEQRNLWERL